MFTFSPMPHEEAAQRIADMPLVTREVFEGLLPELRAYAFTISGIDRFDQLRRVRDELAAVPRGDATWRQARSRIADELEGRLGGEEAVRRSELLLRTHTFRGYAVARYRLLMQQRDVFPYWEYRTHGDDRVRPSHVELNGKVLPAGHPVWQKIFPPNDWGCRCIVVPRLARDVADLARGEDELLPEARRVWDGQIADAIAAGDRLPNGVSILPSPTWSAAPWSEKGTLNHTWQLIQERYASDPEVLRAFIAWAQKTAISERLTVAEWLGEVPVVPAPVVVSVPSPVFAPRTIWSVRADVLSHRSDHALASSEVAATHIQRVSLIEQLEQLRSRALRGLVTADEYEAENDRIRSEINAVAAELAAKTQGLEAVRERARMAVELPPVQRGVVKHIGDIWPKGIVSKRAQEGARIVERFVHASLMPQIQVVSGRGREFHRRGEIHISSRSKLSTVAHEIVHAVEQQHPDVLAASLAFLKMRAGGEAPKSLRKLTGIKGYDRDEIAYEDEWKKRGGDHYTGKEYGGRATELLTMGIERVYRDPVEFASNDPEYFDFVIKTLQKL